MALTAETARAILAQAKADETYEAPIPEDDKQAIEEATELIDQARSAWEENIRGPEVEAILNLADNDEGDGEDESGSEEAEGGEEDLTAVEPWEDYDKEKVADIKAALEWSKENDSEDDFVALASHVFEYESGNKARSTVLSFLEKLGEGSDEETEGSEEGEASDDAGEAEAGSGDADGDEGGEGDGEEDPSSDRASESDADDDASGEADGEGEEDGADKKPASKARKESAEEAVDTDGAYTVSVLFGDDGVEVPVYGKYAIAGTVLDAIEAGATSITIDAL